LRIPARKWPAAVGADLELHFRTMIGTGANPNVAACVVIGIEPSWTQKVVDGIARTGKPVAGFWIEGSGDIATVAAASRKAKEFVHFATKKVRTECALTDIWVAAKCGESDTTTGLASCPTVGSMYDKLVPLGLFGCFGETSELTGAEHLGRGARRVCRDQRQVHENLVRLSAGCDRGTQDLRSFG
jgi:(2R)-sulfolactate sulfo-lyase subunit beta